MGGSTTLAPVNEILALLHRAHPSIAEDKGFQLGVMAGGKKPLAEHDMQVMRRQAKLAVDGLNAAIESCKDAMPSLKMRLIRQRYASIAAHICTAIGGATLLIAYGKAYAAIGL